MSRYDYETGKLRQKFGVMPYRSSDLTRLPNGSGIMLNDRLMGFDKNGFSLRRFTPPGTGFKDAMVKNCGKIVSSCQEHFITNENALKSNIVAELNKVAAAAKPQDVFVMYYAGHGVVAEDAGKEFYLVPHDVTQLYGIDGALA